MGKAWRLGNEIGTHEQSPKRQNKFAFETGANFVFAKPPDSVGAIEAFRSVTEMAPNWIEEFHWLGSALEQRGSLGDAIKMFRKAVQLDINDSRPLISLGICFLNRVVSLKQSAVFALDWHSSPIREKQTLDYCSQTRSNETAMLKTPSQNGKELQL